MIYYKSVYPPAQTDTYVKATSKIAAGYDAFCATDPTKSLVGAEDLGVWCSGTGNTNQRFHIDLGQEYVITRIYYENYHSSGGTTTRGVQNFTIWGSNTAGSFSELTYGTDTGWTQITPSASAFIQHPSTDTSNKNYITLTNTTPYRYYAFKFADNYGGASYMGVRRIELQYTFNDPSQLNGRIQNNWAKDPRCVLLLHCDGDNNGTVFRDSSPSAKTVTVTGDTKTVAATKRYGNASAYFDGTGDYLSLADSDDWDFGNGDFTMSFWMNSPTLSGETAIMCRDIITGHPAFLIETNGTTVSIFITSDGTNWDIGNNKSLGTAVANNWSQYVIIRSGSIFSCYRNGVQTSTWISSSSLVASSGAFSIGYGYPSYYFNGYIDDLAIWKGVAIPIEQLYPQRAPLYDYAVTAPAGV